jgi:predicted XRE-type DNA-binding protein
MTKEKKHPFRNSKIPPKGWPTQSQWKEIERKLKKELPTKILPKNANSVERTKQEICTHFVQYFNASKITQRELAKKLDVTESRISEILHFHHERFTIDKLLHLLEKIKPQITIKVA